MDSVFDGLEMLGPRVLARPLAELDAVKTGDVVLVRPDSAKGYQNRAVVEKLGQGTLPLMVGDVVFYQKFAGAWVVLDGRERLMLMLDEIQARLSAPGVRLVRHDDDERTEHLEGEACLICSKQQELASKANLEAMREELRQARQPEPELGQWESEGGASNSAS